VPHIQGDGDEADDLGDGDGRGSCSVARPPRARSRSNSTACRRGGGTLYASLQKRDEFMKQGAGHGAKAIAPKAGVLRLTLPDVAPGEYALSVMHDANDDRQLNMSPQFIPLEGWAMSNGDALMGPPTFDLVKVTVPASGGTVRATVQYYDGKMPTR
jgi:hypothetical protein